MIKGSIARIVSRLIEGNCCDKIFLKQWLTVCIFLLKQWRQ